MTHWKKLSPYCLQWESYTVTKNHMESGWLYAAICDKKLIGTFPTADEAKAMCADYGRGKK